MASLSDELTIGSLRLRNRIALPPLTTNCAGSDGKVTEAHLRFYKDRSKHIGLVIVEATAVRAGRPHRTGKPGALGGRADIRYEASRRLR